jgi:hypothetical protein
MEPVFLRGFFLNLSTGRWLFFILKLNILATFLRQCGGPGGALAVSLFCSACITHNENMKAFYSDIANALLKNE